MFLKNYYRKKCNLPDNSGSLNVSIIEHFVVLMVENSIILNPINPATTSANVQLIIIVRVKRTNSCAQSIADARPNAPFDFRGVGANLEIVEPNNVNAFTLPGK